MARIRTIKPEFFSDHKLYDLEKKTSFPILITISGSWLFSEPFKEDADRLGAIAFEKIREAIICEEIIVSLLMIMMAGVSRNIFKIEQN